MSLDQDLGQDQHIHQYFHKHQCQHHLNFNQVSKSTRKGFAAGQTCVHSKSPFPGNSSSDEIHLAAPRGSAQLLDFTQFEN